MISVLLPVFNAERDLDEALRSLTAQTLTDFEVIAIDDGSTDASPEILARAAARDPRIHVTRCAHAGIVGALGEAIARARGELFARMDADDIALPERLARQRSYLAQHPACVALGTAIAVVDPRGRLIKHPRIPTSHADIDAQLLAGNGWAMVHPSVMLRRDAVRAVGGYRAEFPKAQDIDLFLRLAEHGELANLAQPLLRLRQRHAEPEVVAAQARLKVRAIRDACARRGIPVPPAEAIAPEVRLRGAAQDVAWSAYALRGGRPAQAARHLGDATRATLGEPGRAVADVRALATATLAAARRHLRTRRAQPVMPAPLFVTAGNARFRPIIELQVRRLEQLGYRVRCFDLGGLGFGVPAPVDHAGFHERGSYGTHAGRTSYALHKPGVIARALREVPPDGALVYLDGDAICFARIDEIWRDRFDLGVTDRDRWDLGKGPIQAAHIGQFNAGVLFLRRTGATEQFVQRWSELTDELGNDQRALNTLLNPSGRRITAGASFRAAGVAVQVHAGVRYNNRERPTSLGIKIVHFKNGRWRRLVERGTVPEPPQTWIELLPLAAAWYGGLVRASLAGRVQYVIDRVRNSRFVRPRR